MSGNADPDLCTHPETVTTLKPEGVLEVRCDYCRTLTLSAYVPAAERETVRFWLDEASDDEYRRQTRTR